MRAFLLLSVIATLLAACGPRITYRYAGKPYRSQEAALGAARKSHAEMVSRIEPATSRIGGTLNLYVPDRAAIMDRGIRKTGEPRPEIVEYVVETAMLANQSLYEALMKRNSFDRVELHYSTGQHITPKSGERAVYLYQPNVDGAGWFFASAAVPRERIHFDMTKPDRAQRVQYWIDSIEALAKIK